MAQFSALRASEKRDPTRLDTFQTVSLGSSVNRGHPLRALFLLTLLLLLRYSQQ